MQGLACRHPPPLHPLLKHLGCLSGLDSLGQKLRETRPGLGLALLMCRGVSANPEVVPELELGGSCGLSCLRIRPGRQWGGDWPGGGVPFLPSILFSQLCLNNTQCALEGPETHTEGGADRPSREPSPSSGQARDATTSNYGKPSPIASTACLLLPLWMKRSSAVTGVRAALGRMARECLGRTSLATSLGDLGQKC